MNLVQPIHNVFVHVTKACNLRCSYCYISADKADTDELTTDEFIKLWPDVFSLRPEKVVITGGEPLLRSDIIDLLSELKNIDHQHTIIRCLNTNGHLVTKTLAERLVGLVDEIRISLDALEERNDFLRGKGNFNAAIKALETFYSVGFEPKVMVTLTSHSLPDLEELINLLLKKKITRINVNIFRPLGRGKFNQDLICDFENAQSAFSNALTHCCQYADYRKENHASKPGAVGGKNCGLGQHVNIMPNGDVYACHALVEPELKCGNIRKQRLTDICSVNSLFGRLAKMDVWKHLHTMDCSAELSINNLCVGSIYEVTRGQKIWEDELFT